MMNSLRTISRQGPPPSAFSRASSLSSPSYGRSPAYRRLQSSISSVSGNGARPLTASFSFSQPAPLRSPLLPEAIRIESASRIHSRSFGFTSRTQQEKPEVKAQPEAPKAAEAAEAKTEQPAEEETKKSEEEGEKKSEEGEEGEKKEKKEDLPPPPPHGDKTPWQVFMETMSTEFKQNKEWNESTKAIADGAHQFTESESVRKAREAYQKSTDAVSSTAGKVLKTTAGAVGKGAAWTWETPVMKGVRSAANVTGDALDKATKPIRDTEAFKSVKSVIDDGSSSRYGGWVEKEERKKARELREQLDKVNGVQQPQNFEEDPKYGLLSLSLI